MTMLFEMNNKVYKISPYTTKQEKEILLQLSFENYNIDDALSILKFNLSNNIDMTDISDNEKKAILYKYREISVGDEVDVKFKCDKCGQGNDGVLNTSNFYIPSELNDNNIKKLSVEVTDDNLQLFVDIDDIDVDELDIDEFDKLKERVIKNQSSFNFTKSCKCMACGANKSFDLSETKYILDIMSDDSLMTLYKTYNFLIFFSHYTKTDIDSMLPFERSIFVGLLNKTKEDLNK